MEPILFAALGLLIFFSFWNGFTDAANAIATIVGTRVLTPVKAVALSAAGNFVGIFLFPSAVAMTMGEGIIRGDLVTSEVLVVALVGGMIWDVFTWRLGLPTSESHVMVGSLVGVGIAYSGIEGVNIPSIIDKVVIPMVTSPTIAFIFGFLLTAGVIRLFLHAHQVTINRYFARIQILSSFFFSVTHGANDGQKVMGLMTALLVTYGYLPFFSVPFWIALPCGITLSLGTLLGGWRIVRTMAEKITQLRPYQGACAETAAGLVLAGTAIAGLPVSTTHAISGSIMGVGATRRFSAVRWGVARNIVAGWVLTMPVSALLSFVIWRVLNISGVITPR